MGAPSNMIDQTSRTQALKKQQWQQTEYLTNMANTIKSWHYQHRDYHGPDIRKNWQSQKVE